MSKVIKDKDERYVSSFGYLNDVYHHMEGRKSFSHLKPSYGEFVKVFASEKDAVPKYKETILVEIERLNLGRQLGDDFDDSFLLDDTPNRGNALIQLPDGLILNYGNGPRVGKFFFPISEIYRVLKQEDQDEESAPYNLSKRFLFGLYTFLLYFLDEKNPSREGIRTNAILIKDHFSFVDIPRNTLNLSLLQDKLPITDIFKNMKDLDLSKILSTLGPLLNQ